MIRPIPRAERASADVTIDGKHYCSFQTVSAAVEAAWEWMQRWTEVAGKRVVVVPRPWGRWE